MKVHKEGKRIVYSTWALIILFILSVGQLYSWKAALWMTPLLLLGVFVTRFFRIPTRTYGQDQVHNFYAPADGQIVNVEQITWNEKPYISISIFMSIWNVHINWIPIDGKIIDKKYSAGKFLMAVNPKSSTENERSYVIIESNSGPIKITQVAGAVARRILTYPTLHQMVKSGQELGFIKFGSRVDILLPTVYTPVVNSGDKVSGMQSILATKR